MCFNVHCNISSSVCSECQPVHCLLVASSLALKPDLPSLQGDSCNIPDTFQSSEGGSNYLQISKVISTTNNAEFARFTVVLVLMKDATVTFYLFTVCDLSEPP